jgi:hypothetical protein
MMTQITVGDVSAQHVGYILSTRKATGMLQCILHFEEEEDTVGFVFAGYSQTVLLNPDDPVVVSGLQDLAVDPAEVRVLEVSNDGLNDVQRAMSQYSKIDVQYRAADADGVDQFWNRSREKVEEFLDDHPDCHLEMQIKVTRGFAGNEEWNRV